MLIEGSGCQAREIPQAPLERAGRRACGHTGLHGLVWLVGGKRPAGESVFVWARTGVGSWEMTIDCLTAIGSARAAIHVII